MNLLKSIIERLNQRVEVANIFDQLYPLCELNANGNEKAWVHYIGNGQAEVVTNFDAKQGTLFWAKRGKVSVVKTESFKVSGCKTLYQTTFPLTAYAVVRKSHLPCDSEDSQDWIASRIYRLISGTDPDFKVAIGVIQYEVIPNGYVNEIKSLTANYEWACVAVDVDVAVVSASEDGCYDVCATGDIPLPDFEPCTPCLTEVAVDGVTITGNGTTADPLVAVGGGGSIVLQTDGVNNGSQSILNLKEGTNITITDDGVGGVTIDASGGGGGGVTSVTATSPLSSSGGSTPDISISQSSTSTDGYLTSTDWNTFDGKFNVPTGAGTDYLDGTGTPTLFPTIPAAQVNSDWNATSGVAEILNKPTIPAAQVNSDWNATSGLAEILNKPTIPVVTGFVPYTGATQDVNLGVHGLTAHDVTVSHPSGSGVAVSVTKGGNGEALTIVKTSGSGNAASITGGVTLIDELHLNTDLADTYIASAATWNAKQDAITLTTTGTSGAATLTGATLNIPIYGAPVIYKSAADSASFLGTTNTVVYTQLIDANTFAAGDIIRVTYRTRKTGSAGFMSLRIYVNATPDLIGTPILIGALVNPGAASSLFAQMLRHLVIKNASNNTETFNAGFQGSPTDINYLQSALGNSINWTLARYFVFALQNNNAADTNFGSMYLIEKL